MDKIKENAKAIATLISGICVAVIAVGVDGSAAKYLAIAAAVAGAIATWAVPNQAPAIYLPADPYEGGYAAAVEEAETPVMIVEGIAPGAYDPGHFGSPQSPDDTR